ncbi:winged helix-turn-helix transcriptional regulator [Microbulbifer sp. CnH-101-E]|uniref:winged helix-turn-helix transcriptional regulator n=1 Tax=unclassified Microbulbifer TaxID=2619833 RepID=UPI00403A34BF
MEPNKKKVLRKAPPKQSARMVETIYGCKWSLTVYRLLALEINRPGEMVRSVEGLSAKVLNECLRKNVEFGILERVSYNEIPPRVEYTVTKFGEKFLNVLEELEKLQDEIDQMDSQ